MTIEYRKAETEDAEDADEEEVSEEEKEFIEELEAELPKYKRD